jgi:hypothetical protein
LVVTPLDVVVVHIGEVSLPLDFVVFLVQFLI